MEVPEYLSLMAEIAVGGLNIQGGQCLIIRVEPENIDAAQAVATAAYRNGAAYVDFEFTADRLTRTRIENSEERFLDFVPAYRRSRHSEILDEKWALLSLKSPYDPRALDGVDIDKAARLTRAYGETDREYRRAVASDQIQWLVMAVPSIPWASYIFDCPPDERALKRMWEVFSPILRLNDENPVRFWRDHVDELDRRAQVLNDLEIAELHFRDEGTDLRIGLHSRARWVGGGAKTPDGTQFIANIPTEEVFTAPDARTTTGRVAITKPVRILGSLVKDGWLDFSDGRVVRSGATEGADALDRFLALEEGNRRLGEVALVDRSSPIARSGVIFQNTLFDENAACHIALGFAFPDCLEGGGELADSEYESFGLNLSGYHNDVMISGEATNVSARLADGSTREIIVAGEIVI